MIVSRSSPVPYRTDFSNGTSAAFADVPREKGGAGDGFGPHDLLEAAVATCMTITVQMYAAKHAIPLAGATCEARLDRTVPNAIALHYSLIIDGDMTDDQRRLLREAAVKCPVARTLTGAVAIKAVESNDTISETAT